MTTQIKQFLRITFIVTLSTLSIISCSNEPKWSIEGKIEGAKNDIIVLEAANEGGYWYTLDSLTIDSDGEFKCERPRGSYPDIYRLNYNNHYIYFPIDSTENITVSAKAPAFDTDYTLSGSANAEMMMHVDQRINKFLTTHKVADLDTASMLKRELGGMIIGDPAGIVSYYIVNKQVKGRRLFRPDVRSELGIIGAVANAYNELRPNDPRTRYMSTIWLSNRPRPTIPTDTIMANEISMLDVTLLDNDGKKQSLETVATKNKVVILNFTNYKADFSQALNIELRNIYNTYHDKGLEIYQIGFDTSEFDWRMAAGNQPWITVYNGNTDENLIKYNVGALPAIFILKDGEVVERVSSIDNLKQAIGRFIQ